MTKAETLYRAGYKAAQPVETLGTSRVQSISEAWFDRNERLDKIEGARSRGWNLIRYALNVPDTSRNQAQYNRGFDDRMNKKGYSLEVRR